MNKLLIIDGHNMLFRMFYGIPSSIKNSKGEEIRGVLGFLGSIKKLIDKFQPNQMIIVFDSETSISSRIIEDSDYKQNRMDYSNLPENENPFFQLQHIYKALNHLSVFYHEAKDYEADDYIASICHHYKEVFEMTIVSTDKDFLQLVDTNVSLYNPINDIYYTPEMVYEKFEIMPHQVIDYKILIGDKSDNIKGVPSIGPKTAVKILKCGSLDEIYNKEKEIDEKLLNKLVEHTSIVEKNRLLVTMNRHIEIIISDSHIMISDKLNKKPRDILIECGVY